VIGSHRRRLAAVALLALGASALVACGSDASVKETQDGKVTVSGKGKKATVTVRGEDGTEITFNEQRVPAEFPGDVPLPQGVDLQSATSGTRSGKQFFRISYALGSASAPSALDAYATRLGDAGFSVTRSETPGASRMAPPLTADGTGWSVLALATDAGAGSMTVTVTAT
jgi:hypothetical protein